MSSLEMCLFRSFVHFWSDHLPAVKSYKFFIYNILENKPLSNILLTNMSSHTLGSLFILMMVSLAMQKLFNLMWSHLFIFSFISLARGDILAKILWCEISEILLPMFSARIFMVSWLIFKSFIHFEYILVYGVSWWSSFSFLRLPVQFSQHHFLKRLCLHLVCLCPLCQILIYHRDMDSFLSSLFCSIDLCVCSYASIRPFDYCGLVV